MDDRAGDSNATLVTGWATNPVQFAESSAIPDGPYAALVAANTAITPHSRLPGRIFDRLVVRRRRETDRPSQWHLYLHFRDAAIRTVSGFRLPSSLAQ